MAKNSYGFEGTTRDDLDRLAAETSAKTDAKIKTGKTKRSKEIIWDRLVKERFPDAIPDVFDTANKRRFDILVEAWGWERMVTIMRFGIDDWKALRQIDDRKFDKLEPIPRFRQFYFHRDRISARWSEKQAREREWREEVRRSKKYYADLERAREEVTDDSPGLTKLRDVIKELAEKIGIERYCPN